MPGLSPMVRSGSRWDDRPITIADPPLSASVPPPAKRRHRWGRRARGAGPLRRDSGNRVVGGVAAGVGRRFGWDPTIVRIVFVIAGFGGGTGLFAYIVGWLALRRDDEQQSVLQRSIHDVGTIALALGVGTLLVAVLSTFTAAGLPFTAGLVWPVALSEVRSSA